MTIDFNCQECDGSFELDVSDLFEGSRISCPNCSQSVPLKVTEELGAALEDFIAKVAELRPRFYLSVTIESDDLPPPYDEDLDEDEDDDDDLDLDDDDDDDFDDDED